MKIYVCWDTRAEHPVLGEHVCGKAYEAVKAAGYDPEVTKARGWTKLPEFLNNSSGRREVRELTGGNDEVPVLVTDSGDVIQGSQKIIDWAAATPAKTTA